MKKALLLIALVVSSIAVSQNLNDYKYALVPARFGIFKNDNYNRLNILTKMFMQKYGFETYMDSETQPADFAKSNCNKVFVDLIESNTMFVTKLKVVVKDCSGKVIAASEEGTSREKDFQVAYNEALRNAFDSFTALKSHVYAPETDNSPVLTDKIKEVEGKGDKPVSNNDNLQLTIKSEKSETSLFAQPITNGYQLINTEPKVIYKIYKTSDVQTFIAFKDATQGVLVEKNGQWFFEYYQNNQFVSEKVDVKL